MMRESLDEDVLEVRVHDATIGKVRCEKCAVPDLRTQGEAVTEQHETPSSIIFFRSY